MLAKVIEHGGEVLGLSGDEAVAHAGGEHEIGKCGNHFLAADPNCHFTAMGCPGVTIRISHCPLI